MFEFLFTTIANKLLSCGATDVGIYNNQYEKLASDAVSINYNNAFVDFGQMYVDHSIGSRSQRVNIPFTIYFVVDTVDEVRIGAVLLASTLKNLAKIDTIYRSLQAISFISSDDKYTLSSIVRDSVELLPTDYNSTFLKISFTGVLNDNSLISIQDDETITDIDSTIDYSID